MILTMYIISYVMLDIKYKAYAPYAMPLFRKKRTYPIRDKSFFKNLDTSV